MSVLKAYFSKKVNQQSPVCVDYVRVVNYDEDGNEYITWMPVDYSKIISANGSVKDWNLDSLLKAGISPDFPIHTSLTTRLEGVGIVEQFGSVADSILDVSPMEDTTDNNN